MFSACKWEDIRQLAVAYLRENQIVVESYWEDHVLECRHYIMTCGGVAAGFFAIHGGCALWLFHVLAPFAGRAQELFARVKKYEMVTEAMVATGDEFFLSHCLDSYARLEKQAYFSVYTDQQLPPRERLALELMLADIDRDEEILALSGDFLREEVQQIRGGLDVLKLYIVRLKGEVVGFGVVQYGRIIADVASIGMFVRPEHRHRGIAANILQCLKHLTEQNGYRAFSGCWYYNHNSKKSMEAAGAYSKSRLIRFYF